MLQIKINAALTIFNLYYKSNYSCDMYLLNCETHTVYESPSMGLCHDLFQKLICHDFSSSKLYFLPDFLMPPVARGPFPAALAAISFSFFCSSLCFMCSALSSSSSDFPSFFAAFKGFFLPPSRPDIVLITDERGQRTNVAYAHAHVRVKRGHKGETKQPANPNSPPNTTTRNIAEKNMSIRVLLLLHAQGTPN